MPATSPAADLRPSLHAQAHALVKDLHPPKPMVYWLDLVASATIGWFAFAVAVVSRDRTTIVVAVVVATLALYRGLCFIHELAHLRKRALPGFQTLWNIAFGIPLLLPSFTYDGVHQSHHSLATYGTRDDPEYLPFARSTGMIWLFAVQSSLLLPILLLLRFLVLSPLGLVWPPFHRWLEAHASSFSMNPAYRRSMGAEAAQSMRRWEALTFLAWAGACALTVGGWIPWRAWAVWLVVMIVASFVNTLRVLGAHDYESEGAARDRDWQLRDSIDTPGGPWTELWAPVGLRYHALHHYFPGIPYHNLGTAYRRLVEGLPPALGYTDSSSPSLPHSLRVLYAKAKGRGAALVGW